MEVLTRTGNSFVSTYMEAPAEQLMVENIAKNLWGLLPFLSYMLGYCGAFLFLLLLE